MDLSGIVARPRPTPWSGASKIPWHQHDFSERMLAEHLDQSHGAASRPLRLIDEQIRWLQQTVLGPAPQRVLDLGCGPGLYAERLARLGHSCLGLDFSPAAIAHAQAQHGGQGCDYRLADMRDGHYGSHFDAALLLFGEFNAFSPVDARSILSHVHEALGDGGVMVLEPHRDSYLKTIGSRPPNWFSAERSVFSSRPHLCLHESFWDAEAGASIDRYFVVEEGSQEPIEYVSTHQAYSDEAYDALLEDVGFQRVNRYPSLSGRQDPNETGLFVLVAER